MADCWRVSVGEQKELLYCPATNSTQILSSNSVRLLKECSIAQTLDTHAQQICQRFGMDAERLPAMRQQLVEFVKAKLLVSAGGLAEQLTKCSQSKEAPPKIASLAVPTRNRPEVLKRCLDSYADCARLYGRNELNLLIMDQSDTAADQEANQQAVQTINEAYNIPTRYFTPKDAQRFASELSKISGVAPDVVNFALVNNDNLPQAHGLSRNFLLLSTLGDLSVQVDDDTICSVTPCRELRPGLTLTSQYAPQEFWFLSEPEVASLGEGFTRQDFFALHEQLLGRSITSCTGENCNASGGEILDSSSKNIPLDFAQLNSEFFRRLSKPDARVAITSIGVAGEAGMEGSFYFLTMDGNSRARIMRSEGDYRFALNYNQVLRSVPAATISSGSVITGHNQGFDNRYYLPPYFPLWRGEDMAFGELLGLSREGAFNGYLPWHILHKPMSPRHYSSEHLRMRASRLSFGAIMEALLQSLKNERERVPNTSIEALGKSLLEWGSAPLAEFEEMLTLMLLGRVSMQLNRLEAELKRYKGLPTYWAVDIEMCLKALRENVVQRNYIIGRDLESFYGENEARIVQQNLVRRFGELLMSWSAIRDAAFQLKVR